MLFGGMYSNVLAITTISINKINVFILKTELHIQTGDKLNENMVALLCYERHFAGMVWFHLSP